MDSIEQQVKTWNEFIASEFYQVEAYSHNHDRWFAIDDEMIYNGTGNLVYTYSHEDYARHIFPYKIPEFLGGLKLYRIELVADPQQELSTLDRGEG